MFKEAMKLALEALENLIPLCDPGFSVCYDVNKAITALREALAEQPAPVQEPVAFLANGTRFKISYDSRQSGGQIHGIPPELGGRWVAFVAADDDCHLKLTSPQPAQQEPVAWTATRLWNRRELWTCPADIERDLVDGDTSPPAQRTPFAYVWTNSKGQAAYGPIPHDIYSSEPLYKAPQPAQQQEPDFSGLKPSTQEVIKGWIEDGTFIKRAIGAMQEQEAENMRLEKMVKDQPAQQEPLTDEEYLEMWNKAEQNWRSENNILRFARAIEAKLRSKNEDRN